MGKVNKSILPYVAFLIIVTSAMVGCSAIPVATAPNSPDATVSISLINSDVNAGDAFTADVILDSKVSLRGAQCAVSFDPALMKCDRVAEGSFFKDWADANGCSTVMIPQPAIDNTTGHISDIGIAIMGSTQGGAKGTGVFCTYYFTALADGVTKPVLSDVLLSDETAGVFPATVR